MKITEFTGGATHIGLLARNGVDGPEADLVKAFRHYVPRCFRWQKGDVAIFCEPQIETGFPDLVVVQYSPKVFKAWSKARSELRLMDLKVVHHLRRVRATESSALISMLGIDARNLLGSLERLLDARLVTRCRRKWIPMPMGTIFGLTSIVAVEAKIKNWGDAFKQGHLNQWFASESYILSPVEKPRSSVLERSQRTGVGIFLLNGTKARRLRSAQKHKIPVSYVSWMFNEWIGRYLNGGM